MKDHSFTHKFVVKMGVVMAEQILIPRLGVNDDVVTIGEWLVNDGDRVSKGQDIVVYETTKETEEGQAPADGYIHILAGQGEEKEVGAVIARIEDSPAPGAEQSGGEKAASDSRTYTKKAQALIAQYHIDVSALPTGRIIREKDVEPLIAKPYHIRETHTNEMFIYGGGGFAHILIDLLKQTCTYRLKGIVDMKYPELKEVAGIAVTGDDRYLDALLEQGINKTVNAVDFPRRSQAYEKLKEKGFELPNLVHRTAVVEPTVTMGEGNLIFAGAMVGSEVVIGNDCVINAGAIVNHECIISDNCHIASGAVLAGCVTVGENTLIGQGCTVYQRVTIGRNVVIQNGCHVFKNVPDGAVVKAPV